MNRTLAVLGAALLLGSAASAQALARRVSSAPDGTVRMTFASRPGVCGDGAHSISFDCDDDDCRHHSNWNSDDRDGDVTSCPCEEGPVRLVLHVRGGKVYRLRAYVAGEWRPGGQGELLRRTAAVHRGGVTQTADDNEFPGIEWTDRRPNSWRRLKADLEDISQCCLNSKLMRAAIRWNFEIG